jgi:hypothetical protein
MCIYMLIFVILLGLKMCTKHACETFFTAIVDYVDHGKNTKSVV